MFRTIVDKVGRLAIVAAALLPPSVYAQTQTKLTLLDSNIINYLPVYVAIDQGIFARHGLTVARTVIPNASYTTAALFSGSAQLGTLSPIPMIQATSAGLDLVAIATSDVVPSGIHSGVLVAQDSSIQAPQDLIGKKVAVAGINGALHVLTRQWLSDRGVDYNRVTFIELPFSQMADALRSGQVDAISTVDPFETRIIEAHLGKVIFDLLGSTPAGTASAFYTSTTDWAKTHPDVVAVFRASLEEAGHFIADHPDQARQILATYTKLPIQAVAKTPMPTFTFATTAEQVKYWEVLSKKQGLIDSEPDAASMVFPMTSSLGIK